MIENGTYTALGGSPRAEPTILARHLTLCDSVRMAALVSIAVALAGIAAIAAVFIWLLRSAFAPIEEQLRRIADEIEIRNTLDSDELPNSTR